MICYVWLTFCIKLFYASYYKSSDITEIWWPGIDELGTTTLSLREGRSWRSWNSYLLSLGIKMLVNGSLFWQILDGLQTFVVSRDKSNWRFRCYFLCSSLEVDTCISGFSISTKLWSVQAPLTSILMPLKMHLTPARRLIKDKRLG